MGVVSHMIVTCDVAFISDLIRHLSGGREGRDDTSHMFPACHVPLTDL